MTTNPHPSISTVSLGPLTDQQVGAQWAFSLSWGAERVGGEHIYYRYRSTAYLSIHCACLTLLTPPTPSIANSLQVAMIQRQQEEKMPTPLSFWGRVIGEENDYLIAFALSAGYGFPNKKFYFCTNQNFTLKQLPELNEEYVKKSEGVGGRFRGDPSFPLEEPQDPEPDAEEGAEVESFREIHRLANTVRTIDHDVAVIPKGSYIADAAHQIIKNKGYEGLSYAAAGDLRNYLHFRKAESAFAVAALEKPGLPAAGDVFDPITADKPAGAWNINYDGSNTSAYLRSTYWPGYFLYQTIGSADFGGVYFGNGQPNRDLAFGLWEWLDGWRDVWGVGWPCFNV